MKYLVIESINTKVDACAQHESGVATVSDGGDLYGVPLVFVRSELLNSRDEAKKIAEMLCREKYEDLKGDLFKHSGWDIGTSCSAIKGVKLQYCTPNPYTLFLYTGLNEGDLFEEWLYNYDILEIDSYDER